MLSEESIVRAKSLDLPSLFRKRGLNLEPTNNGSSFKCLCPFHEEKTPSLNLSHKESVWLWNCFGCGEGGSAIDFIMKHDRLDFKEAVQSLSGERATLPPPAPKPASLSLPERTRLLTALSSHYHQNLIREMNRIPSTQVVPGFLYGPHYLSKRGFLDETLIKQFKIGYSDGATLDAATDLKKERTRFKQLGIFTESYYENFNRCVTFPVLDPEGQVTDLYGRRTWNKGTSHLYNSGSHVGIWNASGVQSAETVILTESIIDALSIYKCGFKNVTALFGASSLTEAHQKLLTSKTVQTIILALDQDEAGYRASSRIAASLKSKTILVLTYPANIKDPNALLVQLGEEALFDAIQKAYPFAAKELPLLKPDKPTVPEENKSSPFIYQDNHLHYKSGLLSYVVRNAQSLRNLNSLRFIITATYQGQTFTDRIDLYLSRSRRGFEASVSKNFGLQPAVVEEDLLALTAFIESDFKRRKSEEGNASAVPSMTVEQEREALSLLRSKDLIPTVVRDLTTLGYVGEDANKLLLYMCATSRKLDKPISVLIRSQSSTGKSFLIDKVCDLLPTEDVHKWTSLTPKALYYMAEDALKHKFIAIDERAGMEDAEYPIRSLQSGGQLSLAVPLKNPSTGKIETEQILKQGPIAYVDGSTDTRVNPENANRCFEIFLDESAEQTLRVQKIQRRSHSLDGWKSESKRGAIKRCHQNAQRLLKPVKVIIPFIHLLAFPSDWIRTRRDHDRFLSLIVCIAFLHQYQREQKQSPFNQQPYIEATVDDYRVAYQLAQTVLFHTFQELEKPLFDFYRQLEQMVQSLAKSNGLSTDRVSFTRRIVRDHIKIEDYLIKRYLKQLSDLEYFHVKGGGNGSRNIYRLTHFMQQESILKGLTRPEDLETKLNATKAGKK